MEEKQPSEKISPRDKWRICARLFLVTFRIGAVTFGGGYAMIPIMKAEFVDKQHWIDEKTVEDVFAVAQSIPGAIAINSSIMIGARIAGFWGSLAAMLGVTLPSLITLSIITLFYQMFITNPVVKSFMRGIHAGVLILLASAVVTLGKPAFRDKHWLGYALAAAAFLINLLLPQVNSVFILIGAAVIGLAAEGYYRMAKRREGRRAG